MPTGAAPTEGEGSRKGQGEVARGQQTLPAVDRNTTKCQANPPPPQREGRRARWSREWGGRSPRDTLRSAGQWPLDRWR